MTKVLRPSSRRDRSRLADTHNARALEHFGQGRPEEAIEAWRAAARLDRRDARFPSNVGAALVAMGRDAEAVPHLRTAIRLKPDLAEARDNLGVALKELDDYEGAIAEHLAAIRLRPDALSLLRNLAATLDAAGRPADALAVYDAILRSRPGDVEARFGRGIARLTLGDFAAGWPDFEARHDRPESLARQMPGVPRWRGEQLAGTLLLNATLDGHGDAIQGVRFAPEARRRAGSTVLLCDPPLARLMARFPGVDRAVTDRSDLPPIAAQASVLGLAAVLGGTEATMLARTAYLSPDPATVERWRPTLADIPGCRVGVIWQGCPSHINDRRRSFRLADLARLAEVPGVSLVSLQRGAGSDQLAGAGFSVVDLGPAFAAADPLDVAGILEHLDLVIAADTGVAHLAASIGRPVWIALPGPAPDWRWLRGRDDSPWYPTVRLFRQGRPGDWDGVFRRAAEALTAAPTTRQRSEDHGESI